MSDSSAKERSSTGAAIRRYAGLAGRVAVLAVLLCFIYTTVSGLIAGGVDKELTLSPLRLALASLVLVVYYISYAQGMALILRGTGSPVRLRDAFALNFVSNLGKYLPGGVWPILGRYTLAERYGVKREHAVVSTVFENLLSVVAGTIVALVTLGPSAADAIGIPRWTLPVITLGVLACLHPAVFGRLSRWALSLLKSEATQIVLPFRKMVVVVAHYMLTWCIGGIAFAIFVGSIVPGGQGPLGLYIGAHAAASIGGLLVLFAPGGIGVREAILAAILAPTHGVTIAIAIGVATRLWSTVVELIISGIAAGSSIRRARREVGGDR